MRRLAAHRPYLPGRQTTGLLAFLSALVACWCLGPAAAYAVDKPSVTFTSAHSSNYSTDNRPQTNEINYVVIHIMEGSYEGSISWFRNSASNVSAHYCISREGDVTQMVRDKDRAWHAGNALYNREGIGIEHEGRGADPGAWTEAMLDKSATLTAWICETYGIPVDKTHIKRHKDVRNTSCPGSHFDYDGYLQRVRNKLNGGGNPPPAPVYDAELTSLEAPGQLVAGSEGVVTARLTNRGNTTWTRASTFLQRDPAGANSPLYAAGNWVAPDTPTALDLPADVGPGETGTFAFVARTSADANGTITERFRLMDSRFDGGGTYFGPTVTVSINVTPPDNGGGVPLEITTTVLPDGTLDTAYNSAVNINGGVAPYTAVVGNGSLPPGLVMNADTRAITGTPTSVGSWSFDVTVTDAANDSAMRRFTITIDRGADDPNAGGGGGCAATTTGSGSNLLPVALLLGLLVLVAARRRLSLALLLVAVAGAGLLAGCKGGVPIAPITISVSSVSPGGGPLEGGTTVIVRGDLFVDGAQVFFGDAEATSVRVIDGQHIECVVPAVHPELGEPTVDVTVVNPDTTRGTATAAYEYSAGMCVVATTPVNGDTVAPTDGRITIEFNHEIHPLTLVPENFLAPGFNVTVTQTGPTTAQLQLVPQPAPGQAVTVTVTDGVTDTWGMAMVPCACGCGAGAENPQQGGEPYVLTFTASAAGTLADQSLQLAGQLVDESRGQLMAPEKTLAVVDPLTGTGEVVFLQSGRATVATQSLRVINANPDVIEVEGAVDLTTVIRPGGTVRLPNSANNRGTYRVAHVGDTRLTLADYEQVFDEARVWADLEITDANPQLMRASVRADGRVTIGEPLDADATAPIVVEKLQTAVAASGRAAAILRITEGWTGQDVHGFVWRSGRGWTSVANSLVVADHPGFGGTNRPLYPRLTMCGDVPVIAWVNGAGDAIVSRFENGAWTATRLYTNPTPGNVSTAAAVAAAHFSTASHGVVVIGVRNVDQLQLLAHGWADGSYGAAQDLLAGDAPLVPADGNPVRTVSAGSGDLLLMAVPASAPHELRARRYDAASNSLGAVQTAWSGVAGVDQIAAVVTGEETAADGMQVAHLTPTLDGAWVAVTLADGSTRAVRYDANGDSFGAPATLGTGATTRQVWLHRDIDGRTHALLLEDTGADAIVTHSESTGASWTAPRRVDSLDARITVDRADTPVAMRARFDNAQGINGGDGELLLVEERAGRRQLYTAHYRAGQGFGPAMPLGTDGQDHGLGAMTVDLRGDGRFVWLGADASGQARADTRLRVNSREGLQPTRELAGMVATNVQLVADRRLTSAAPTGSWRQLLLVTRRDGTGTIRLDAWHSAGN